MKTKNILFSILLTILLFNPVKAQDTYQIETENTVMVFTGKTDGKFLFNYFGLKAGDPSMILMSGIAPGTEAYPAFGLESTEEKALHVTHADGNLSADLYLKSVERSQPESNVTLTKVNLYDNKYPFFVTLFYKAYYKEDVIEVWSEISHKEKKSVTLHKFASFFMPVYSFDPWLSHFHGNWSDEFNMVEEAVTWGMKTIKNRNSIRATQTDNPSFMLSLDGKPDEDTRQVIAGTLAYTGNYKLSFDMSQKNRIHICAGINEEGSHYKLEKDLVFQTPPFVLTYSDEGKGGASRNLHRWARNHKIKDGRTERMVLLNSWEGVYFDVNEKNMLAMVDDIAMMGGELFVMDDGWFGDKYPRDNEQTSLGDWMINPRKFPNGLQPIIDKANEKGIKFGIWFEPEMVNVKSELFEKHPDWIIHQPNRETILGRGGSQMSLDMANPKVQDYVFDVINDLLLKYPDIAYIKWDANHFISNVGSTTLPADKQSHVYIEYHKGLIKVLERIYKAHPNLIMQACSSGGGRVTYGYLEYFHEFWTSDNTDAFSRLFMQWGTSHFYPAINMASHVSASPNHQTGRELPLKFRVDIAMTGRFGFEMQPKDLNEQELEFSKEAVQTYKSIRPVVQFGDLYRLVSPYDNTGLASLMYVSEERNRAVVYAFNMDKNLTYRYPALKLKGLNPDKRYKITEINMQRPQNASPSVGKVFTGEYLMKAGININMRRAYQSAVFELTEVE
jgi:alpha-galactosidase